MKLNWAERWVVNNQLRVIQQRMEVRWMRSVGALQPGSLILEIGCGRGAGAELIQETFQPAVIHSMDLDIQMIRKAYNYLSAHRRENIFLYVGDALHLPYRNGVVDAVFGFGVLHHVLDWASALAEIARVLKNGGVYFFEELYPTLYQNFLTKHLLLHPRENRFFSQDLKGALKKVDLSLKNTLELKHLGIIGMSLKHN
jgi:ubiquinone/menaquinone biosynthesis C-methylase UbiE